MSRPLDKCCVDGCQASPATVRVNGRDTPISLAHRLGTMQFFLRIPLCAEHASGDFLIEESVDGRVHALRSNARE